MTRERRTQKAPRRALCSKEAAFFLLDRGSGDSWTGKCARLRYASAWGWFAGRKACICTCIFCRTTTLDQMHANVQVYSKHQPENRLMEENTCALASFLLERIDIGENRCIFAGFRRKNDRPKLHSLARAAGSAPSKARAIAAQAPSRLSARRATSSPRRSSRRCTAA